MLLFPCLSLVDFYKLSTSFIKQILFIESDLLFSICLSFDVIFRFTSICLQRSSHQRCSVKKAFLEILQNSLENTCATVWGLEGCRPRPGTLLKINLWHRCFPVNFAKFLKTPFPQNTSGRLLLPSHNWKYCFQCIKTNTVKFRNTQNYWNRKATNWLNINLATGLQLLIIYLQVNQLPIFY